MNKTLKKITKRTDTLHDLFSELSNIDSSNVNQEFMEDLSIVLSSLKEDIDDITFIFFPSPYENYLKNINKDKL